VRRGLTIALLVGGVAFGLGLRARTAAASAHAEGMDELQGLAAQAGIPQAWRDFLVFLAWGESRGDPNAHNDSPSEVDASIRAWERVRDRFALCVWPPLEYQQGSGGLFGFLMPIGLAQIPESYRCLRPDQVFDPRVSLAMAIGYARGLMRWDGYERRPSWLSLRHGWSRPSQMGVRSELDRVRPAYREHAAAVGLPAAWLDRRPPPLDVTAGDVLERLGVPSP
jgi:hypothetical protein